MRIGFIAMSGIRAQDPELLKLGLTLPGFVERSKVVASLPSLGLLTLAALTAKHHHRQYIDVQDLDDPAISDSVLKEFDLVAISSLSAQIHDAYQLADRARALGVKTVMGGLHVTALPDEALEHADCAVVGEGEPVWPSLMNDFESGNLQPIYQSDEEFDLAQAPIPAFELLDIERYNRLTVQTSRGCNHSCEFCASSILLTQRYKQKPMAKVLAEIDRILEIWPRPFIEFADDNSFVDKNYWRKLLPELARRKVRWFTESDLSIAEDPELLKLMRESGCAQILIGFETPDPHALYGLETRSDWKVRQVSKYMSAIRNIQSHGISVNGCFILGLDQQESDCFDAVHNFVDESNLHEVQITIQTAFPGTPLYRRLLKADRLLEKHAWETCTLFDINFEPQNMSVKQLRKGFHELSGRLYSEEATRKRKNSFRRTLRDVVRQQRMSC
jgi:radical SAM superfamily enzyme YgiQ (UPF0313 family)